jgi:hypothetical protein
MGWLFVVSENLSYLNSNQNRIEMGWLADVSENLGCLHRQGEVQSTLLSPENGNKNIHRSFKVFTAVIFEVEFFSVVTPCSVVGYQRFEGSCCLHLGVKWSGWERKRPPLSS